MLCPPSSTSFPTRDFDAQVRRWRPWAAPYRALRASELRGGRPDAVIEAIARWPLSARCSSPPAAGSATRCSPASSRARCDALRGGRRGRAAGARRRWRRTCRRSSASSRSARALPARYDAAVVTWATLRTALLPLRRASRSASVRRGGSTRRCSPHRVVVRSELGDRTTHWTQILLDYARAIGCDAADATPAVRRCATTTARRRTRCCASTASAAPFYVLHPTRGLSAQRARWPIDGFVALARRLLARDGIPVLVTGSADDAPIAARDRGRRRSRRDVDRGRDVDRRVRRARGARARRRRDGLRARCTSRPPSARRRSASSRCSPTSPTAGRRAVRRVAVVRPDVSLPALAPQGDVSRLRLRARARRGGVLAALDGLLAATAER